MDTVIVSDLHLSDADTGRTDMPFWKAYKRKEHFFDDDLVRMIRHVEEEASGSLEIVFNGDVFDFVAGKVARPWFRGVDVRI